ncbi:hypothetical protein [Microbacterium sp. A93]|uniref:hypothetical protein n=1 Tax=Microbacterium sp. A93 TaxID=3450716 RepID=UPI003F441E1B
MTNDSEARDRAGRALYEQGQAMLPGLGQPPAPGWEELDESVRERWRRNAAGQAVVTGPTAPQAIPSPTHGAEHGTPPDSVPAQQESDADPLSAQSPRTRH